MTTLFFELFFPCSKLVIYLSWTMAKLAKRLNGCSLWLVWLWAWQGPGIAAGGRRWINGFRSETETKTENAQTERHDKDIDTVKVGHGP